MTSLLTGLFVELAHGGIRWQKMLVLIEKNLLTAMRETIISSTKLLNMERVSFHGEFINVQGIELDIVHGRKEPRFMYQFILVRLAIT